MDPNETMVEQPDNETADDALEENVVEEQDESEESLSSLMGDEGQPAEQNAQKNDSQGTSEPGWIRKRVDKAVQRAVAETEARMKAQFDAQMAPIREKMLTDEARELVRQGEFKSLDRAKEYLQLKQGMNIHADSGESRQGGEQPRNERGQFASKQDPAIEARIDMLAHQADSIKERRGIDVIAEFSKNEDIKNKVISGEMDFYDVAEMLAKNGKKRPPSPMRSPNGASGNNNPNAIEQMSDEQFDRMERNIKEKGARYSLR